MAKWQAVEFLREKPGNIMKCDTPWEPGIAKVQGFGTSDVEFIVDNNGKKLNKAPFDWRLIQGLAYCAIDTEHERNHSNFLNQKDAT